MTACIYAVRADAHGFHQLRPLRNGFTLLPARPRSGARILYVTQTVSDPFLLYTLAWAWTCPSRSRPDLGHAAFIPKDGKTIAYAANNDIRLVDADGSNDRLLAPSGFTLAPRSLRREPRCSSPPPPAPRSRPWIPRAT